MTTVELAKKLKLSEPTVSELAMRGQEIVAEEGLSLLEKMKLPAACCGVSKRNFAVVRLAFAQRRRLRRMSSLQQAGRYSGEGE
ncbi:MAG: hypothetical protein JW883_15315 [Deltaproteobacteria bacterium]|nr:hypothetical protein [Deltaproteobacteria bacterium]